MGRLAHLVGQPPPAPPKPAPPQLTPEQLEQRYHSEYQAFVHQRMADVEARHAEEARGRQRDAGTLVDGGRSALDIEEAAARKRITSPAALSMFERSLADARARANPEQAFRDVQANNAARAKWAEENLRPEFHKLKGLPPPPKNPDPGWLRAFIAAPSVALASGVTKITAPVAGVVQDWQELAADRALQDNPNDPELQQRWMELGTTRGAETAVLGATQLMDQYAGQISADYADNSGKAAALAQEATVQLANMTPALAASALTYLATRKPELAARVAALAEGGQIAGDQYAAIRQAGGSRLQALLSSAAAGAAGAGTVMLAPGVANLPGMKALSPGRILRTATGEAIQEGVQQFGQATASRFVSQDELAAAQFHQIPESAAWGFFLGGVAHTGFASYEAAKQAYVQMRGDRAARTQREIATLGGTAIPSSETQHGAPLAAPVQESGMDAALAAARERQNQVTIEPQQATWSPTPQAAPVDRGAEVDALIEQGDATRTDRAWFKERMALVNERAALDPRAARAELGQQLETQQNELIATTAQPEAVAAPRRQAAQAKIDELLAQEAPSAPRKEIKLRKPQEAAAPQPAPTAKDDALLAEVDRLQAIIDDPASTHADRKAAQQAIERGIGSDAPSAVDELGRLPDDATPQAIRDYGRAALGILVRKKRDSADTPNEVHRLIASARTPAEMNAAVREAATLLRPNTFQGNRDVNDRVRGIPSNAPSEAEEGETMKQAAARIRAERMMKVTRPQPKPEFTPAVSVPVQPLPATPGRAPTRAQSDTFEEPTPPREVPADSGIRLERGRPAATVNQVEDRPAPQTPAGQQRGVLQPTQAAQRPVGQVQGIVERTAAEEAAEKRTVELSRGERGPFPAQQDPADLAHRTTAESKPRDPTPKEAQEVAVERDRKMHADRALSVKVGLQTAQLGVKSTERGKAGEKVSIAPIDPGHSRSLKPRLVTDLVTGKQVMYAPPAFHVGKIESGPFTGKYAVFSVKSSAFAKNPTIIAYQNSSLLVPASQAADVQADLKAHVEGLAFLRGEAALDEGVRTEEETEDLVGRAKRAEAALREYVATSPTLQKYNAPYQLALDAKTGAAADAARDAGDLGALKRALAPHVFDSYEAAHHHAITEVTPKLWKTVADAEGGDVTTQEDVLAAGGSTEEGEQANAGVSIGKTQAEIKDLAARGTEANEDVSRGAERNIQSKLVNTKNPGEVTRAVLKWDAAIQSDDGRAARAWLGSLKPDDITSAWVKFSEDGNQAGMTAAEAAALAKEPDTVGSSVLPITHGKAADNTNPFLSRTYADPGATWESRLKAMPEIPGIKTLGDVGLQYAVRAAQLHFPGIDFSVDANLENPGRHRVTPTGREQIQIAWTEDDNALTGDEKGKRHLAFLGTLSHELFHSAFDLPGVRQAIIGAMNRVSPGFATRIREAAEKTAYYEGELTKRAALLVRAGVAPERAAVMAKKHVQEEVIAYAITSTLKNVSDPGVKNLVKVLFTAPEMHQTVEARHLLRRYGKAVPLGERASVLASLREHFARFSSWIDKVTSLTADRAEAEARTLAQDQLGTESDLSSAGQGNPESRIGEGHETPAARVIQTADPQAAGYALARALGEEWQANAWAMSEVITAAIRYASGRESPISTLPDGTAVFIDSWSPETALGREARDALRKLPAPEAAAAIEKGFQLESWEPGDTAAPFRGEEPTETGPVADPDTMERLETRRMERVDASYAGLPDKPSNLAEKLTKGLRRAVNYGAFKYRELGMANLPKEAITAVHLDRYGDRLAGAFRRSQAVNTMVSAPLLDMAKKGATEAQIEATHSAFVDRIVLGDAARTIDKAIAAGQMTPATRLPLSKHKGGWTYGTYGENFEEFLAMCADAQSRAMADPVAREMARRYDAVWEGARAEAARVGVADALDAHYYHHQVLAMYEPDVAAARELHKDVLGLDANAVQTATGSILKARTGTVADINLNVWESLGEAVNMFERIIARGELSQGVARDVSSHAAVARKIASKMQDHTEEALADLDRKDVDERLAEFFGSIMHSDRSFADRPWMQAHSATLAKLKDAFNPEATTRAGLVLRTGVPAQAELRALANAALTDAPPAFVEMVQRAVLADAYYDPHTPSAALTRHPEWNLAPGMAATPALFRAKPPAARIADLYAEMGSSYAAIAAAVQDAARYANTTPEFVLPENIARELYNERAAREAIKDARVHGAAAFMRKASVVATLSSPLTVTRYLLSNVIGNPTAMAWHDPASLGYIPAAMRLLSKHYYAPEKLTTEERAIMDLAAQEGLLGSGLGDEFRLTNDPVLSQVRALTSREATRSLGSAWWNKTWGLWEKHAANPRRMVDDYARIAMLMHAITQDAHLNASLGSAIHVSALAKGIAAGAPWLKGEGGAGRSQTAAAAALGERERGGESALQDVQEDRRVGAEAGTYIRGVLGDYATLSRLGESPLGRGFLNPFVGYTDNLVRETVRAMSNMVTAPGLKGKAGAIARGAVLGALIPLFVRLLNAALNKDDDEFDAAVGAGDVNPWTEIYLGKRHGGKGRTFAFSSVQADVLRTLGLDTAHKDIKDFAEYADRDFGGNVARALEKVGGRALGYIARPQVAYLQMPLAAIGQSWDQQNAEFKPSFDRKRQALQPWGLGPIYDWWQGKTGQTGLDTAADLFSRQVDVASSDIRHAKNLVQRFNRAQKLPTPGMATTMDDVARLRYALRSALLRGDSATAHNIISQLNDLDDREVGPDNLLKSFGASDVLHGLGNDGKTEREEMKQKFLRWLSPEDRDVFKRAQDQQDRVFDPYKNPDLMSILRESQPEQPEAAARTLVNALARKVAEARTTEKMSESRAAAKVAEDTGSDLSEVRAALRLQKLHRQINAERDEDRRQAKLEKYLEEARKAGFAR
jgi:hypothetical protein